MTDPTRPIRGGAAGVMPPSPTFDAPARRAAKPGHVLLRKLNMSIEVAAERNGDTITIDRTIPEWAMCLEVTVDGAAVNAIAVNRQYGQPASTLVKFTLAR